MSRERKRKDPPPAGFQCWNTKLRPTPQGRAARAPIAQACAFGRFRGAGRSRLPAAPTVVTCLGSVESREAQVVAGLLGESVKRKGKPEGVQVELEGERQLRFRKAGGAARAPASASAGWASVTAAR